MKCDLLNLLDSGVDNNDESFDVLQRQINKILEHNQRWTNLE